ncbi:cupin domain-containing protein [Catellatospora citrea]|uniref:cupin domain-containing protein n=1 Tax=Catellatospora citrea TaxID=53366 RepID=UPI0033FE6DD2
MSALEIALTKLEGAVLAPAGSNLALAEWTAQGTDGDEPLYQAPLHRHAEDEAWYVLTGVLRIRAGDHEVEIGAGGAVVVPGGTPHTYWNPGREPARYLLVMGIRTWQLIQAIHAADDRSPENLRRLFEEHGGTLLE